MRFFSPEVVAICTLDAQKKLGPQPRRRESVLKEAYITDMNGHAGLDSEAAAHK